ncbi:MAG: hypothetical protein R2719_07785 [Micropruina sp.]
MDLLASLLLGVLVQVGVYALIPFAYWMQSNRSDTDAVDPGRKVPREPFLRWLGFRPIEAKALWPTGLTVALLAGLFFFCAALISERPSGTWSAAPLWLVFLTASLAAVFQFALADEVFFRGFPAALRQRMIRDTRQRTPHGYPPGTPRPPDEALLAERANWVQAAAYGLVRVTGFWLFGTGDRSRRTGSRSPCCSCWPPDRPIWPGRLVLRNGSLPA